MLAMESAMTLGAHAHQIIGFNHLARRHIGYQVADD